MKLLLSLMVMVLRAHAVATEAEDAVSTNHQKYQDRNRALQGGTTCNSRLQGLVCETTTTTGAAVQYTANCPLGADEASDCLPPQGAPLCYQYNSIPCISSFLCGANGPIASDCSNIFAASTGSNCSHTDCAGNCLNLAATPVDYNAATATSSVPANNTCRTLGFSTLASCPDNISCIITNEWWHVLSDGQEIQLAAVRAAGAESVESLLTYQTCTASYGSSNLECGCSVDCPASFFPPAVQYDCGAYSDDACAAVDCSGLCVNVAGQAPVPFPMPPPSTPMPVMTPDPPTPPPAPTSPPPPNCELELRAFSSRDQCVANVRDPTESATIIPDGACRSSGTGALLPGNYRAVCDAPNRLLFFESACLSCDEDITSGFCTQVDDATSLPSYLYSAQGLPQQGFDVVPVNQDQLDCITLSGSTGSGVTFVVFGTCGPECLDEGGGGPPPMPQPTNPPIAPTDPPVADPVAAPVVAPMNPPTPEPPVTPPMTAPVDTPIAAPTSTPPGCELSIRVFDTAAQCSSDVENPVNSGILIPDGTCRDAGGGELLPGIYRAECTPSGQVRFLESGCQSLAVCTSDPNALCGQNINTPAFLYAALEPPVYDVAPSEQDSFSCSTITGNAGLSVSFLIQGTCSPDCSNPQPPMNAPVVAPVVSPVTPPVTGPTSPLETLVDLVVADPELSTLEAAVIAAGLVDLLNGPGLTVFAPLDEVFAAVDPALLTQLLTPEFILHLQELLAYHVVDSVVLSTDLSDGLEVTMFNGETLTVQISEGSVFLTNPIMENPAFVVDADNEASNGVMHKIGGSLLLPSFLNSDLVDLLASEPNYSTLVMLVQAAGLEDAIRSGTLTILAPDNAAFDALPDGTIDGLLADPEGLAQILLYHAVQGVAPSQSLTSGVLPTLNGESLVVEVLSGGITFNGVPVVAPDGLARNGIAHGISGVLLPDTDEPVEPPVTTPTAPVADPVAAPVVAPDTAPMVDPMTPAPIPAPVAAPVTPPTASGGSPWGPVTWQAIPTTPTMMQGGDGGGEGNGATAPPVWGPTTWTAKLADGTEDSGASTRTITRSIGPWVALLVVSYLLLANSFF